jgi:fructose-1,6-bisphosphatase/inositol monophosphatase family enzyme
MVESPDFSQAHLIIDRPGKNVGLIWHQTMETHGREKMLEERERIRKTISEYEGKNPPISRPTEWTFSGEMTSEQKAEDLVAELFLQTSPILTSMVRSKIGRENLGDVRGRGEGEDTFIGIDAIADQLLMDRLDGLANTCLSFLVLSEHSTYKVGTGNIEFILAVDPFDNSNDYMKGIYTIAPHLVAGAWKKDGKPIACANTNLNSGDISLSRNGKISRLNRENQSLTDLTLTEEQKTINFNDPNFIMSYYAGKEKYRRGFNNNLSSHLTVGSLNPIGGAHTYADDILANVMIGTVEGKNGEPVAEIWPGVGMALMRGYKAYRVDEDTEELKELRFDFQHFLQNPERYAEDRVPFMIVAATRKLAEQIRNAAYTKPFPEWDRLTRAA